MCYQTRQIRTVKDLELRYNVTLSNPSYGPLFDQPSYHLNGFTHPNMLIIPQQKPSVLAPGIWGMVPESKQPEEIKSYHKESIRYGAGLNARSEKVFDHFLYRNSIMTKRCIVPVTGFFEPHTHKKKKFPFFIHRQDDELFSLAGIYTVIGRFVTFTILTKTANTFFAKIHNEKNRQPILLNKDDEVKWLSNKLDKSQIIDIITKAYPISKLEAYSVSKDLYKRHIDTNVDSIADKVTYEELSEISFI